MKLSTNERKAWIYLLSPVTVVSTDLGNVEENGDCEGGQDVGEDPQLGAVAHLQGPVQYWSVMHSHRL